MSEAEEKAHRARSLVVEAVYQGQRLDNFLMSRLKGVPRSRIYRIVRSGEVRVNSSRARPSQRLFAGDEVRIPPVRMRQRGTVEVSRQLVERLPAWILYEDERLLALNKPPGLAVHGGSGLSVGLIEALRESRPNSHFLELVHRLDRDTSGCILVAKTRDRLLYLHEAMRQGTVEKHYTALVAGNWPRRLKAVHESLEKSVVKSGERVVVAAANGQAAETRFEVLRRFGTCTLLDVRPITGRMHQIRVHAQAAGYPLAGDRKYGDKMFNRDMRKRGLRRLFLHASRLVFRDEQGIRREVCAPLEPSLQSVLDHLAS